MGIVNSYERRSTNQQFDDYEFYQSMYGGQGGDSANHNEYNNNTFGGNSRKSSYQQNKNLAVDNKQRPSIFLGGL